MDSFDRLRADPRIAELVGLLGGGRGAVAADGLWGSCAPILAALAAERTGRPLLIVTAHGDEADDFRDDIETVLGREPALLPQLETLPGDAAQGDDELAGERLRLCLRLLEGGFREAGSRSEGPAGSAHEGSDRPGRVGREGPGPLIIVAPIQALMQLVPTPEALLAGSRQVRTGERLTPESFAAWLDEGGYNRCEQVEAPGEYAPRGGIVDVFAASYADPVRVEFFGDEVESLRFFEAGTQRSAVGVQAVRIPARGGGGGRPVDTPTRLTDGDSGRPPHRSTPPADRGTGFFAYLPADTLIAFHEPVEIQEIGRSYWQRVGERAGMVSVDGVFRKANEYTQLHLGRLVSGLERRVAFAADPLPTFAPKADEALLVLEELAAECDVVVLCDNRPEEERFEELLEGSHEGRHEAKNQSLKSIIKTTVGILHRGFRWNAAGPHARPCAFVPHHELFQRYRQRRTLRKVQPARPIDSFFDLGVGDYVVHALHGIGRFRGLETIETTGKRDEYLAIEFAGGAVVHTAVSQIHLVQKYIGSVRGKPALSTLGGTAWRKTKERVAASVSDLAGELLVIQAERATRPGVAFPGDTAWQREFEGSFLYEETPDQLRALDEIKTDLSRPRPMDRLLCGDVGFGKTELAIRAAFKVVEYGKQVAVLVPTTVLAEQHYQTFRERLADYPFSIEAISRFRTKREQSKIVERANKGQLDILIGTHRLLSADVKFADLGLVVIDEEQRFGVEAKERLKRLRATVDVLTLSATPIPRTLHMAMVGVRDISSLATAPVDRRAIVTQVRMWDDLLVRDALLRELSRDGQVYVVHNFVKDIQDIANRIRRLVPDARVVVGHGQMPGDELEDVMLRFMRREADVLVSTNIIESGLDIPSANTMLINRAERFGLADLHQLRGRVGRSKHRAYCYLLLSPKYPAKELAARRLKAIERYSDLGAGFQIAMRDLEIRGAGNMLGAEQSGHIEAVGYEMYCQLLEQSVRRLRNEEPEPFKPVNLDLRVTATIPRAYIRSERQRMEVYKRLTSCRTPADIRVLTDDLRDAFGPLPADVQTLLALAEIRVLARPWGVRSLVLDPPDVIFSIDDLARVEPLFKRGPGSPRVADAKTIHWRLPVRLLEIPALLEVLRTQLAQCQPQAQARGEPHTGAAAPQPARDDAPAAPTSAESPRTQPRIARSPQRASSPAEVPDMPGSRRPGGRT